MNDGTNDKGRSESIEFSSAGRLVYIRFTSLTSMILLLFTDFFSSGTYRDI